MNLHMNSVESVVAQIQGLSGDINELTQLSSFLKQSEELLHTESSRLAPLLNELDPSIHSLGYLYILDACTSVPVSKEQVNEIVLSISKFINFCAAEQIRLAPDKFISVCKRFKDQVMLLQDPMRGVAPMLTALRKLRSSSEHLTTLHPDYLLLCLLSKCYKSGLSILEDDIFEVEQPRDLLLYCYYGGIICIGQKQYPKAMELLHNVVTAPMSIISAIAVEAYKKYILVSLVHLGQFSTSFPKYTSSAAQRNLKNFSQPYLELVNSYSTGRISELETFVQANKDKFESDKNLGLVKQVVSSMYKRNIQRLTQTYLTLSLQDIANTVQLNSPKEAEMHVLQMIQDGEIYATINQKDGMVRFLEDPEQYRTCEMIERIDSSIRRAMTLSKKVTTMNELMSCDLSYLGKAGKEQKRFDFDDFDNVPSKFNI
ncbi:COP9 signalosome complex subunit 3 [Primulina huaijiensis]|uniref:COP9 signalosome complex subunit 3 n=1 Tax=Primulina huaijiensis TaxID=1492673 RepID=UPI003CC7220D